MGREAASSGPGWHETVVRVRYGEVDRMGVVHHRHYLTYFEHGRTEMLRDLGASYAAVEDAGTLLVVVETGVRYMRPGHYEDDLTIRTRLAEARGVRVRFAYEIRRMGVLLATGFTVLADVFRTKFAASLSRPDITGTERMAAARLKDYGWPGNVRELENVIERAVILAVGPEIVEADLPERLKRAEAKRTSIPSFDLDEPLLSVVNRVSSAVEREYLKRLLRRYRGHVGQAAEHAGINRRTLYTKLQAHDLRREDFR